MKTRWMRMTMMRMQVLLLAAVVVEVEVVSALRTVRP